MLENEFFKEVHLFIFEQFKNKLKPQIVYHNFNHTLEVVKAASEIGLAEKISDEEFEILLLSAWFHDVGFVDGFENHEENSKIIVENYLKEKGFSSEKINEIKACIDATKIDQSPVNKIQEIMCDADLHHLGKENFIEKSNLLRLEWEQVSENILTDIEWLKENEKFVGSHKYFTNYAFSIFNEQKSNNWIKIQKELRKAISKKEENEQKFKVKKDDLKRKKEKNERPERGIETLFRVTLRNHIKLSDIADTKANILLSVSAIILSIALSSLFPKLDKSSNYYLIFPTLFFLLITVLTMIFSILSTRPKVTSGKFSKEDVAKREVNLLFFGSFHKMPLEEFQEGMEELMVDRAYLYKTLMRDLYFLGKVLDKKYRTLRIAYTIFMFGIVISVIWFVIAFELMKSSII